MAIPLIAVILPAVAWAQTPGIQPAGVGQNRPASLAPPHADEVTDKDRAALDRIVAVRAAITASQSNSGPVGVTVEVENVSGKTITAYAGVLLAHYASGKEESQGWLEDVLMDTVLIQIPGITTPFPKTLRAGEILRSKHLFPRDPDGSAPLYVSAKPTMVAFEDRTALGGAMQIKMVSESRLQHSDDLLDVVGRLRAAQTHPKVLAAIRANADPLPAIRSALSEQINQIEKVSAEPGRGRLLILQEYVKYLSHAGVPASILDSIIMTNQVTQRAMADHANLTEPQ